MGGSDKGASDPTSVKQPDSAEPDIRNSQDINGDTSGKQNADKPEESKDDTLSGTNGDASKKSGVSGIEDSTVDQPSATADDDCNKINGIKESKVDPLPQTNGNAPVQDASVTENGKSGKVVETEDDPSTQDVTGEEDREAEKTVEDNDASTELDPNSAEDSATNKSVDKDEVAPKKQGKINQ